MRYGIVLGLCSLGAGLALGPGVAEAQGPSAAQFETWDGQGVECALANCTGLQARRRSRLGNSVLAGAVIGAGVGLITSALVYEACSNSEDSRYRDTCGGRIALAFGIQVVVGAVIGLIVGGSEPSRGPVPTN